MGSPNRAYIIVLDHQEAEIEQIVQQILKTFGSIAIHRCGSDAQTDFAAERTRKRTQFFQSLTERQQAVCRCVLTRKSNQEIARHLGISEGVVAEHLTRIFQALEQFERTWQPDRFQSAANRSSLLHFFGDYFDDYFSF